MVPISNLMLLENSLARNSSIRQFSVAYNVKSKFEEAYNKKMEGMSRV